MNEAQRMAKVGSWELDLRSNHLTWSDETFRILEIDKTQFKPTYKAFLATIHPDDREAVDTAYTRSLEVRTPYGIEHRFLFTDGRVKYVLEQCETTFSASGQPLH
ncbi:PAS domain-containing protein [Rhodoferax sp. PAMC 29310]|uniref:PAS domain-containing protein n=1 Tax=Rhodoferax sp. PAMC 29310 TaxID=2822760 RepID=UPI001B31AC37|nr:PAS domain-containing protein [Rhodoferax sp. PAMC 29310]